MQSPVPGQQQQPQPATQWVVAAPRPTTVPNYKHRQSIFLGVTLITVGTLSIVFNIIDLAVWSSDRTRLYFSLGVAGHGLWSGCMCIVAGGIGIGAGRKQSWCLVRSFLVLCIIAAFFCLAQFAIAVAGAAISGSYYNRNNYYFCCVGNCSYFPDPYLPARSPTSVCQEVQTLIAMESLLAIMAFIGGAAAICGSTLGCRDWCCPDPNPQRFVIVQDNVTPITVPAQTQQQTGNMTSVAMQYPNTNPPPYPVDGYQFPYHVPPEYSPPSTDLVSQPQLPPLPEVLQHHASASVSLQPSAPPDYKN